MLQRERLDRAALNAVPEPECYIGGRWVRGEGAELQSLNPTTGELLGSFRSASMTQVDAAIAAARDAFDGGPWAATSPAARADTLRRLAALMERDRDVLIDAIVADVGTPVSMAGPLQVSGPLKSLHWFADAAERGPDGWYDRALTPDIAGAGTPSGSLITREPIGVVAAIATWNFPFTTMIWKMCGALAAGCTVVLQPSPKATHSTLALWRLIDQIELPPGVVNLVLGDADVGERLTTSADIDMVTFTGSVRVGGIIMAQASGTLKKLVLELGGKSPAIVLPGSDLDDVVKSAVDRLMGNSGQRCGATSRILVHRSQIDAFTTKAQTYIAGLAIGDPRDPATQIGPLIDHGHMRSVRGYIDRALAAGGHIAAGGLELPAGLPGGAFLSPVLIGGLTNDSELCQEEQFGPVGALLAYDTVEEAIGIANATRYGLNAMIFGPTEQAIRIARRLRCGTVTINGRAASRPEASWGGYGQSGLGREGGDDGFREFFETKHIQWSIR